MRLRRTAFPEPLMHNGRPTASYWFVAEGEVFGVSCHQWDHGPQWEVFHAGTYGVVRDDWDRLADLRAEAPGECQAFLGDLRREEEDEATRSAH